MVLEGNILDMKKKRIDCDSVLSVCYTLHMYCGVSCWLYCKLKVLSSVMDQAKSGLIRNLFIKGRGAEILSKFRPPPILWELFKGLVHLLLFCWQFGNGLELRRWKFIAPLSKAERGQ